MKWEERERERVEQIYEEIERDMGDSRREGARREREIFREKERDSRGERGGITWSRRRCEVGEL